MDKRKILGIVVVLAVIVIVGAVYLSTNRAPVTQTPQQGVFNPQQPPFIYGTVISATASQIQFNVGGEPKTATINSQTKLIKQIVTKGVPTLVSAETSDFKANSHIVLYFTDAPKGDSYSATKIQIVGQ